MKKENTSPCSMNRVQPTTFLPRRLPPHPELPGFLGEGCVAGFRISRLGSMHRSVHTAKELGRVSPPRFDIVFEANMRRMREAYDFLKGTSHLWLGLA